MKIMASYVLKYTKNQFVESMVMLQWCFQLANDSAQNVGAHWDYDGLVDQAELMMQLSCLLFSTMR